jgi:drug/metabolite transporter (DMT)-like permease
MTIPLSKVAVSSGHQPMGLIFWQLTFSAIMLALVMRKRIRLPILKPRYLLHFLIIGLLGTLLPNSITYLSIAELPAGVMAIIIASVPMFALLFALLLRLERFVAYRVLGVLLGGAAVLALIGPEASLPDPGKSLFVLLALIAPACYGLEGCYLARYTPLNLEPAVSLLGASVIGALIAAPLALATDTWVNLFTPWGKPEWALLLASSLHVVAYTGYIWLVGRAGAVFASQIAYIVTIAGVLLSALLLSEIYSGWVWAALALMIAGVALVQPRPAE